MHRILFTVMHSHMQLLPMTALEGKMMIDCVQGVRLWERAGGRRRGNWVSSIPQAKWRTNMHHTRQWRRKDYHLEMKGRERGREIHSLPHSCLICKVLRNHFFFSSKRMKRFFWSQKGLLSFLGSLSGRDVISINYLPHQRDRNMLAPFCFSHLIALFTEQLPMDNKCTHAPRCIQDNRQTQAK